MKLKTWALIGLGAMALKGCPYEVPKFDASKVDQFRTLRVDTVPGLPTSYFKQDVNGDGIIDPVCAYKDGNVFYAPGKNLQVAYNRVLPGSEEAKRIQASNPSLEIRAGSN